MATTNATTAHPSRWTNFLATASLVILLVVALFVALAGTTTSFVVAILLAIAAVVLAYGIGNKGCLATLFGGIGVGVLLCASLAYLPGGMANLREGWNAPDTREATVVEGADCNPPGALYDGYVCDRQEGWVFDPTNPRHFDTEEDSGQQNPPADPDDNGRTMGAVSCMTDSQMRQLFGFGTNEMVRTDAPWDSCKWDRQNAQSTINFELEPGWGLTYTDPNGDVWVTIGQGQFVTALGYTLRQPGNQFLSEGPQGYLNREWTFGYAPERGSDQYPHCPDQHMVELVNLTDEQVRICAAQGTTPANTGTYGNSAPSDSQAAAEEAAEGGGTGGGNINTTYGCPTTSDQVAQMVGGEASMWTEPDWTGGAWVFASGGGFYELSVPQVEGAQTVIDYYNSNVGAADQLETGESLSLSDASFHCHAR